MKKYDVDDFIVISKKAWYLSYAVITLLVVLLGICITGGN